MLNNSSKKEVCNLKYVLIILSGGIIDQVTFYDDPHRAVSNLSGYVKAMDPEKHDAAVYGPDGLIANAKLFLNKYDQYPGKDPADKPIYIIANPCHSLGFLVISSTEPIGFTDPVNALSVLERMRKEHGDHINLYRAEMVKGPVIFKKDLEIYNTDLMIDYFEYSLVSEYLE